MRVRDGREAAGGVVLPAMIEFAHGNLLTAEVDALVNTVNTEGVMGKGIALQFKRAFPANYEAYRKACRAGEVRLGHMFVYVTGSLGPPRLIINFPTKAHWRSRTRLQDVDSGLVDLVRVINEHRVTSVAVPPLGCGNGGLDWRDVRPRIEEALGGLPDVRVLLYPPEGAPVAATMPTATRRPTMTPGRAALVGLLGRYLEPGFGASRLEVQKLLYLLQVLGEPLRLKYIKAQYGPYAEAVNHVLNNIEGHYVSGFGDRTNVSPLQLLPGATEEADDFLGGHPDTQERVNRLLDVIDGFESPYGLELLASVHWVTQEVPAAAADLGAAVRLVQEWSRRKEQLFTERHVAIAWERLRTAGLLGTAEQSAPERRAPTDGSLPL